MEADRAFINRHMKRTASCLHRRSSTPGGSERGEDPALPMEEGKAEPVPSGKRVSADTGRCKDIYYKILYQHSGRPALFNWSGSLFTGAGNEQW